LGNGEIAVLKLSHNVFRVSAKRQDGRTDGWLHRKVSWIQASGS